MRDASRWCGPLLVATGVIHLAFGIVVGWDGVVDIVRGGIDGANEVPATGETWFWFLVAGLPMLLAGHLVARLHARTGEIPAFLGWYLLLFAALVYFMPASGFWIFLPQAAFAFYVVRADSRPRAAAVSSHAAG